MAHKQGYAQTKMRRIVKAMDFDTTEWMYPQRHRSPIKW